MLSIVAVLLVVLLKPFSEQTAARFALLAIASVIVLRYLIWRLLETLPPAAPTLSFAIAVLLFTVELYSNLMFFLNAFINADPTTRKMPPRVSLRDLPTVDILVPSYNEPTEMLAITLLAAKNMIYPVDKRTVVLCDDGGTDQRCNSDNPSLPPPPGTAGRAAAAVPRPGDRLFHPRAQRTRQGRQHVGGAGAAERRSGGGVRCRPRADP
ncbi:cellulose synthase [Frigidibacter mobilis]|uniref:Cellulose synthase n=1 Tax=Frigidibacter mobilis TaxID=1335048 RepID=A0A165SR83_9RHOB|nr:cellulose synthase [Frigidibacter mobilis]